MTHGDVHRRRQVGLAGRCSGSFGLVSTLVRAAESGTAAEPLKGMGPWTCSPLVSAPRFGRWFGRTNPAYAKREKALSFLLIISANQALVPRTHNPLVPGSSPGGPTNLFRGLGEPMGRPGDNRSPGLRLRAAARDDAATLLSVHRANTGRLSSTSGRKCFPVAGPRPRRQNGHSVPSPFRFAQSTCGVLFVVLIRPAQTTGTGFESRPLRHYFP
jgi:hypothetical protein